MKSFPLVLAAVAAALSLSACATVNVDPSTPGMAERMIVRGSLAYRERIALPLGSVAEVTLQDVSRADAPSTILARQTIPLEGRQVPVPFNLEVDRAQLQSGMRYSVRGIIRDSEGRILWTTDTAHAVDTSASAVDLGMLLLVHAGSPAAPDTAAVNAVFQCGPTRVHTRFAGDYLRISMDGRDYDLSRAISASGARYEGRANNERISFWNKGRQATLSIGDRTYPQCNQMADEDEAVKLPHKEPS